MQKEEYNTILNEMKPFMEGGRITTLTESKWMQSRGVIRLGKNNEIFIIMKPGSYNTEYQTYRKKLNDFWKFMKYLKVAQLKKKPIESKEDDMVKDAVSKF